MRRHLGHQDADVGTVTDEKTFQKQVIDLAHLLGWTVAHFRPAKTSKGWRTPVAADGKGFPDLVLVGHDKVMFRELKAIGGRLSDDQEAWGAALTTHGADWAVWTPNDWPRIIEDLGGRVAA